MQWANLCRCERLDRNRLTLTCYEFDLDRLTILIAVHDRADVTCLKTVRRQGTAKYNKV